MITRRAFVAAMAAGIRRPFAFSFKGYPGWALERAFAVTAGLGYTGVELFEPGKLDAREVNGLARRHRLPVVAIMEDLRLTGDGARSEAQLEASCRLAARVGRPVVETVVGGKPEEWEALRGQFAERLKGWARIGERHGVDVAIKAHVGSALHRAEDAAGLCREVGSRRLRVNYDYSHMQLQGWELEPTLRAALPYVAMIHIKDWTGTRERYRFALPGKGSIDYGAYAALLDRVGYRGPIVVEVSTHVLQEAGYDPEAAARFVAERVGPRFR